MENYYDSDNKDKMNLIIVEDKDEDKIVENKHLVLIKNFNTLLNDDGKKLSYYCERCLAKFST
jgi:hypothetical protein